MPDPIPRHLPSKPLTRREALFMLGAGGAALWAIAIQAYQGLANPAGVINLPPAERPEATVVPDHFQLDLDSNTTLTRANNFDNIDTFARETGIPADMIRATNGILPNEYYVGGEFLLLPTDKRPKFIADRRIENPSDHDIVSNAIARVLPRPEIGSEDFTPEELKSFNVFARRASRELRRLLGPPTNTGFIRIQRGTQQEEKQQEQSIDGLYKSWLVEVTVPNRFGNVGLRGSSWVSRIYVAERFEALVSEDATQKKQPDWYLWERYLAKINAQIRHEVAHYWLGNVNFPPFKNHDIIYAVDSLALEEIPDRGYVLDGRQQSPAHRYEGKIEWYKIRQNPQFFAKLVPWARERTRTVGQPPTEQEVITQANKIDPRFSEWKSRFDSPIGRNPIKDSDGILRTWDVRWPNDDEMAQGWFADYEVGSTVSGGLRLYRSHHRKA